MSAALAEILSLSEQLHALSREQDWQGMLALAKQRQEKLEHYFGQQPLPDDEALIRSTMTKVQSMDQTLMQLVGHQRQHLLQEAMDLRQRWQMSNTYQRVQNLQT